MASLHEIETHRASIEALTALAERELGEHWQSIRHLDPADIARDLRLFLPELIGAYAPVAAELGASFYEAFRAAANLAGSSFLASLASDVPAERVQALVGFGVSPLFADLPDVDKALSLLSGGLQRVVSGADRNTIRSNAERDPASPVYMRQARAGACAFCALLATRDAVYGSQAAAELVVGRGAMRRSRGTQSLGHAYHDKCHCVAVPVWPGQDAVRAPYVDKWERAYLDAPHGDIAATLAHMRSSLDVA